MDEYEGIFDAGELDDPLANAPTPVRSLLYSRSGADPRRAPVSLFGVIPCTSHLRDPRRPHFIRLLPTSMTRVGLTRAAA